MSSDDGGISSYGKWKCDGCGGMYPLRNEPANVIHGQTSSGGFSISFCLLCEKTRQQWERIIARELFGISDERAPERGKES